MVLPDNFKQDAKIIEFNNFGNLPDNRLEEDVW